MAIVCAGYRVASVHGHHRLQFEAARIALRPNAQSNSEICSLDAVAKDLMPCMSDHIYKKIELVGSSPNGIEDAVNNAIGRASKTIRNMKWFEPQRAGRTRS